MLSRSTAAATAPGVVTASLAPARHSSPGDGTRGRRPRRTAARPTGARRSCAPTAPRGTKTSRTPRYVPGSGHVLARAGRGRTPARRPAYHRMPMAVAHRIRPRARTSPGEPLLRGVSFKLERRDRLTLAGRNGAGKTTLLRMLAGEASIDGGELVFAEGHARRAARPAPAARARPRPARLRALGAAPSWSAIEAELSRLEQAMADGDDRRGDARPLRRGPGAARARGRLRVARPRDRRSCTGSASSTRDLDRALRTFSGGELTRASLARALASRPRPAAARRADEPPRHRVARVARAAARRSSTPRSCSSPTTAGSSRRSAPRCSSSRAAARASSRAPGTRGARRRRRASSPRAARGAPAGGGRAPGALRRALPRRRRARARRSRA